MSLSSHCIGHPACGQKQSTVGSRWGILLLVLAVICAIGCAYFALRIAPAGLSDAAPTVEKGLSPEWIGSREILCGHNPYRVDSQQPVQTELRSGTHPKIEDNQYRYAYPAYFAFLFFPLALLPFQTAQKIALIVGIGALGASFYFWLPERMRGEFSFGIVAIFSFASYPLFLALQLRQPTIIFAAMMAGAFFCVRSKWPIAAGILAGLSLGKPQLAIPVLLPLSIWSLTEWRTRKAFLLSLLATFAALLAGAEIAVPGWIPRWVSTLQAYAHYTGANPPLLDILPRNFCLPAYALLVLVIIWVSLNSQHQDLLFPIAFSTAAFELMLQFQIYNEVLLLPATLWILEHRSAIRERGQITGLLWLSAWALLVAGWVSQVALTVADLLVPGSGVKLWQVPLVAVWLYPWPLFLTLSACAITPKCAAADNSTQCAAILG
jgi:hypothetical protein